MKKRYAPPVPTPSRNWKFMLAPGAMGVPTVTVPADKVEFNPQPNGRTGPCSRVKPCTVAVPPPVRLTTIVEELSARMSALPPEGGSVVTSTTRNRSRVTGAPVLFVNLRRIESVPLVYGLDAGTPPFGAEGVKVSI